MDVHYSNDIDCAAHGTPATANHTLPIVGQVHAPFPRTRGNTQGLPGRLWAAAAIDA